MPISCVYCGASHPDASAVRACWQRSNGVEAQAAQGPLGLDAQVAGDAEPPRGGAARSSPHRRVRAGLHAAPGPLGRNLVVLPGATVPPAWQSALRVHLGGDELDAAAPVAHRLREAAAHAVALVFEVEPDAAARLEAAPHAVESRPPHTLGARHELPLSDLHHLVWSNSIDARHGETPAWGVLDAAVGLGATPVDDGRGDVVLPGGGRAWIDGGPIRFTPPIDGVPVVHRVAIEHGSPVPFEVAQVPPAGLAPDQLAAVVDAGGAARIIAPAGSGKTRVLTERARHLLRRWPLPAAAVCLVAFNKRAQEEIRARTADLRGLQVRTLNSIALAIVNGTAPFAPRPRQLRTVDEGEVRRIVTSLVSFPRKRNADPVATWIEALSLARLGLRDPADVESLYDGEVDGFADVLPRFRAQLAERGWLDFDEQVQLALEVLLTDPAARAAAQRACRVMLVDEFQDLTPAHVLLVRLLAGPDAAVFGVGDDDQTIYGYNGADPAWLIEFDALFPGSTQHQLEVNYRCPAGVVAAADQLLRHNVRRVPKVIRAARAGEHGWRVDTSADPVRTTVETVRAALAGGTPASEIAVLARVNSSLAPVQVALGAHGVGFTGGVGPEFLERTAVRSALAWLRLTTGTDLRSADLAEAIRRPSRPMSPSVATWVTEQSSLPGIRRLAKRLGNERDSQRVDGFADDLERLQAAAAGGAHTGQLLHTLHDTMGLAATVGSLDAHRRGMNRAAQGDDLSAVTQLAAMQPEPQRFEPWLREALARPARPDGVTLATVHRVKGQEWPVVVVHQADDDQFPHRLADDVEEERRLFHVALTRAAREAAIVTGPSPSPFVRELTEPPATERSRPPATTDGRATRATAGEARARAGTARGVQRDPAPRPAESLSGADLELFEALRSLRLHLAAGKPAYTVLADATLARIAVARPASLAELAVLKGIGPSKLDLYGAALLATVETARDGDAPATPSPG